MSLSNDEMARLIISVGKGGTGGIRLLTPIQVGAYINRLIVSGLTISEVSATLSVSESIVSRFASLSKLSDTVQSLVEFNASRTAISFSAAHQIARLGNRADQEALAKAALEYDFSSKTVEQVVQSVLRSGKSIDDAIAVILTLRPIIERHHIIIGSVNNEIVKGVIRKIKNQEERDAWGSKVLRSLIGGSGKASVRLTAEKFTISGDEELYHAISSLKPDFESAINRELAGALNEV